MSVHFVARVSRTDSDPLLPDLVAPLLQAGWGDAKPHEGGTGDPPAYGYAWTVGSVAGSETLVQTRPVARSGLGEFTKDFLRTSSSAAIGMISQRSGPFDPPGEVARFHRWIGVARSAAISSSDETARAELEHRWVPQLPDFLRRARSTSSASEWGLLLVLSELHAMERLSSIPPRPEEIRAAVVRTLEKITPASGEAPDLLISDGATVAGSLSHQSVVHAVDARGETAASSLLFTTAQGATSGLPDAGFRLRTASCRSVWSLHTEDPASLETSA